MNVLVVSPQVNNTLPPAHLLDSHSLIVWFLGHLCLQLLFQEWLFETEFKFQGRDAVLPFHVRARGWMQWILHGNACGNELTWNAWTKVTRLSWKAHIICFIFHRLLVPFWALAIKLFYNRKYVGWVRLLPEATSMNNEQWTDLSKVFQVKTQLRWEFWTTVIFQWAHSGSSGEKQK